MNIALSCSAWLCNPMLCSVIQTQEKANDTNTREQNTNKFRHVFFASRIPARYMYVSLHYCRNYLIRLSLILAHSSCFLHSLLSCLLSNANLVVFSSNPCSVALDFKVIEMKYHVCG